jgi:hypothetical protein
MTTGQAEIATGQSDGLAPKVLAARLATAFYVGWGLLHLIAARGIYDLASTVPEGLARARLEQGAWNLALFALQAMAVATLLNWHNNRIGYWLNIIIVGVVDLLYVLLLIVPGYIPASLAAWAGPITYLIAATFSTAGFLRRDLAPPGH